MPRGGGISRQQQAFEALLEPDDDIVDGPAPGAVQPARLRCVTARGAEALVVGYAFEGGVTLALCLSPGRAARQPRPARHRSSSTAGRRARRGSPVFQLRCDASAEGEACSSEPRDAQETRDLRHLQELFSRSFERSVVEAVYDAEGGSLAATSAALLSMSADSSSAGPASSPAAAESDNTNKGKPRQAWWASVAAWQ